MYVCMYITILFALRCKKHEKALYIFYIGTYLKEELVRAGGPFTYDKNKFFFRTVFASNDAGQRQHYQTTEGPRTYLWQYYLISPL